MQDTHALRAAFARSLSAMYGTEVPAYTTLVEVSTEVNADHLAAHPETAERLGSIGRVTAERHGAIRVGTAKELAQVAQIFAALGMEPVGFYDLRGAEATSLPIVSTAFRPVGADALARNPFRVFTSVLVTEDRRYFDAELTAELDAFLATRTLFGPDVLELAARAEAQGGLAEEDAEAFLRLATACFELGAEPVDRAWYARLAAISGVAADIGGVPTTHINHLTPRVLDIDDLYARMTARGITMIDEIQGPPLWDGPDVLLRQTSFKALAEPRRFREADASPAERADVLRAVWRDNLPATEQGLAEAGLAHFTYEVAPGRPAGEPPRVLAELVAGGWLIRTPIVYEDFLPRSAAGIFASNLDDAGSRDASQQGAHRDEDWFAGAMGRTVHDPQLLYAAQEAASLVDAGAALGVRIEPHPRTAG